MLTLTDRRVLVTGGTRGAGRATVLAFARAGATVATCYHRDAEAAESLVRELKEIGAAQPLVVEADVTRSADVARLAEAVRGTLGGLDVLVNNVGVDGSAPLPELEPTEWHRLVDLDLTSFYLTTRAVLPLLAEGAAIVNIGASSALRGRPDAMHYTSAKAAVIGLTRSLAKELGGRGIRVNVVAPGLIEPEAGTGLPPHVLANIRGMTALGRLATPEDVAGAVLFLGSDLARYVTGVTINVDGGM
ncbi:SDR family NAD(P)-dependent oxidoreductase [Asanoa sp. WMMD1127]|uniref:SDR family NAD(P)-dependent oxidoreductase n=1 Tax=Asanoa sp. WMMD1127 TaxID=3016107 RepID=UPI00241758E1|nr:SDR family NAD(P)-dependent oxidoreductase [Asanoa sp. WMMD1127]MDG4820776.1 SDR family NAD(P)-dependent oxidoreductase [Asanoa sp. WMMD1127]